jgi:hypothetical protein
VQTDCVTKALLAAIAFCLAVIAVNGLDVGPSPAVAQQPRGIATDLGQLRIAAAPDRFYVFDPSTGRLWQYSAADFTVDAKDLGRIAEPGKRLLP